tara:strand:- start:323 stop:562 length:240 start_codon:yes stop_codon:yes gene_type:complete
MDDTLITTKLITKDFWKILKSAKDLETFKVNSIVKEKDKEFIFILDKLMNKCGWHNYPLYPNNIYIDEWESSPIIKEEV